jgi:hypothetical protein
MRDDGENGRLGSPTFLPWPAARPAVFRLRPCVRLLGLYLRALGSLPLVSPALVSGSSVLVRSLVAILPAPKRDGQVRSPESRTYDTWTVAAAADQTEVNVCSDMAQMCWVAIPRLYSNGHRRERPITY